MSDRARAHPIEDEHIRGAIGDCVSEGWAEAVTLEEVDNHLTEFQDYLQSKLSEELNSIWKEGNPDAEEQTARAPWYGDTYDYILLECWSPDPDIAFQNVFGEDHPINQHEGRYRVLLNAHERQFRELIEKREIKAHGTARDLGCSGPAPVVIQKPYNVVAAQNMMVRELRMAIKAGASPAEAVDYLMAETPYHATASKWAETRERSPQAISQNINRAKEKLEKAYWNY